MKIPEKYANSSMSNTEKFNAILNSRHNPEAIYDALVALGEAGFFQKKQKEEDAV